MRRLAGYLGAIVVLLGGWWLVITSYSIHYTKLYEAYNIVKQVGNYGQIFEANVGVNTALGIPRGVNEQWYKGGLMFAAPFR